MMLLLLLLLCATFLLGFVETANVTDTTNVTEEFIVATDTNQDALCSLCGDNPDHFPQDPAARFDAGGTSITCSYAYSLGSMNMPQDNCTFLQNWGSLLCQCGPDTMIPNNNNQQCRLCEKPDSALLNGYMAGFPQITCAELQVQASRDDDVSCSVYQATVGQYCGCENPQATMNMCRLCGDDQPLPNHLQSIPRHSTKSCGELEFDANLPDADCWLFQKLYGEQCCDDPTIDPSNGRRQQHAAGLLVMAVMGLVSVLG